MEETRNSPYCNEEDRISSLPETLIHYILTLLGDMKYVVPTSVLSKRWTYVWTSLPSLTFDSYSFFKPGTGRPIGYSFVNFVDKVLILRDLSTLKRFELSCCNVEYKNLQIHINTWIIAAVRRNVEEVDISVDISQFLFPHCLFTCQSLSKLDLVNRNET